MPQIENSKIIIVTIPFGENDRTTIQHTMYCEFQPDEIILKYVSSRDMSAQPSVSMFLIKSSLFDGQVFWAYARNDDTSIDSVAYNETVNTPFKVTGPKTINGTYDFTISPYGDPLVPADLNFVVSFTFMFLKYKEYKKI